MNFDLRMKKNRNSMQNKRMFIEMDESRKKGVRVTDYEQH